MCEMSDGEGMNTYAMVRLEARARVQGNQKQELVVAVEGEQEQE